MSVIRILVLSSLVFSSQVHGQEIFKSEHSQESKRFSAGIYLGMGWAYEDKSHLFNSTAGISLDYQIE